MYGVQQQQQQQIQNLQQLVEQQNQLVAQEEWLSEPIYKRKKQFLATYQEKDLTLQSNLNPEETVYRLIYQDAFCPTAYIYKFSNVGDSSFTISKTYLLFEKVSELEFKLKRIVKREKTLSEENWALIDQKIQQSMFWSLERRDKKGGMDGYTYLVEGALRKSHYFEHQEVYRWTPAESCFLELCKTLRELGGDISKTCY